MNEAEAIEAVHAVGATWARTGLDSRWSSTPAEFAAEHHQRVEARWGWTEPFEDDDSATGLAVAYQADMIVDLLRGRSDEEQAALLLVIEFRVNVMTCQFDDHADAHHLVAAADEAVLDAGAGSLELLSHAQLSVLDAKQMRRDDGLQDLSPGVRPPPERSDSGPMATRLAVAWRQPFAGFARAWPRSEVTRLRRRDHSVIDALCRPGSG